MRADTQGLTKHDYFLIEGLYMPRESVHDDLDVFSPSRRAFSEPVSSAMQQELVITPDRSSIIPQEEVAQLSIQEQFELMKELNQCANTILQKLAGLEKGSPILVEGLERQLKLRTKAYYLAKILQIEISSASYLDYIQAYIQQNFPYYSEKLLISTNAAIRELFNLATVLYKTRKQPTMSAAAVNFRLQLLLRRVIDHAYRGLQLIKLTNYSGQMHRDIATAYFYLLPHIYEPIELLQTVQTIISMMQVASRLGQTQAACGDKPNAHRKQLKWMAPVLTQRVQTVVSNTQDIQEFAILEMAYQLLSALAVETGTPCAPHQQELAKLYLQNIADNKTPLRRFRNAALAQKAWDAAQIVLHEMPNDTTIRFFLNSSFELVTSLVLVGDVSRAQSRLLALIQTCIELRDKGCMHQQQLWTAHQLLGELYLKFRQLICALEQFEAALAVQDGAILALMPEDGPTLFDYTGAPIVLIILDVPEWQTRINQLFADKTTAKIWLSPEELLKLCDQVALPNFKSNLLPQDPLTKNLFKVYQIFIASYPDTLQRLSENVEIGLEYLQFYVAHMQKIFLAAEQLHIRLGDRVNAVQTYLEHATFLLACRRQLPIGLVRQITELELPNILQYAILSIENMQSSPTHFADIFSPFMTNADIKKLAHYQLIMNATTMYPRFSIKFSITETVTWTSTQAIIFLIRGYLSVAQTVLNKILTASDAPAEQFTVTSYESTPRTTSASITPMWQSKRPIAASTNAVEMQSPAKRACYSSY